MTTPVPPELQHAFDREREGARTARPDEPQALAQTVQMYGRLAELQTRVVAERRIEFACARGCSYCCHLRVEIRPHEALGDKPPVSRYQPSPRRRPDRLPEVGSFYPPGSELRRVCDAGHISLDGCVVLLSTGAVRLSEAG